MALVLQINTARHMVNKEADVVVVNLKGDGYEVKQQIHKKYTNGSGEVKEVILCIARKIHFEKAAIELKFKRLRKELKDNTSSSLEAEITTQDDINLEWTRKLSRLNKLLGLLENGRFLLQCTLMSCPNHSVNKGTCQQEKDLTEILKHFPEFEGCADGRTILNIAARRYGDPYRPTKR